MTSRLGLRRVIDKTLKIIGKEWLLTLSVSPCFNFFRSGL